MDDPLATLAPSDPTWNPAQTVPPEALMAAQNSAQNIPPTQQTVDVNTPPPADQMAPVPSQLTSLIPSETAPNNPDIERHFHEAKWRSILSTVGTIMGGDKTLHVKKDTDGNITVTHDPSTEGEKWGRIAAAALGGAAQGLANSQGPGGAARAAAAGTQYGLQLPQQRQQEADAQATAEQKRMTANANNAMIQQRAYSQMLDSQGKKLVLDTQSAALMNEYRDGLASSPEAKDFGAITSEKDLMDKASQNADFMKSHMDLRMKAALVPGKNGFELHAVATDPGDDAQPIEAGAKLLRIETDPDTGKPRLVSEPAAKSTKKGFLRVANSAVSVQFAGLMNNYTKAQDDKTKAERERIPTTSVQAMAAARLEKDPERRTQLEAAARDMANEERKQKAIGRNRANTGAGDPAAERVATIRNSGGSIAQALGVVPTADQGIVRGIGEGRSAPYSRATKEGQRIMGLVNSVYTDYDASRFPVYQAARTKFTSGTEGQGLSFIRTSRNHLARMEKNIPDNFSIPFGVGSALNWAKNAAKQSTDPKLKDFAADMEAVSSEVARAYKGGVIGVEDHKRMAELLSSSDSPEAIRATIQEFRELLKGKLQSYRDQWNSSMPSGVVSPLSTLENLETESDRPGQPTAAPAAGAPAAAAPSYPVLGDGKGSYIQWNGKEYASVPAPR